MLTMKPPTPKPYLSGVLKEEVHGRLVADIANIASDAAIHPEWIWTPLKDSCGEDEIEWVRKFKALRSEGMAGLVLTGKNINPERRCMGITGALVRNFIRARLMTLNQCLESMKAGASPSYSCLIVPNFFIEKSMGGSAVASWQTALLHDMLLYRHTHAMPSVLYVSDMKALGQDYGEIVAKHLQTHYTIAEIDS